MTSIQYYEKTEFIDITFDERDQNETRKYHNVLLQLVTENKTGLRVLLPDGNVWLPKKNNVEAVKTFVVRVIYGFRKDAFKKMREAAANGKTAATYPYECPKSLTGGTEVLVDAAGNFQPATVITCEKAEKATLDTVVGNGHHVKPVLRVLNEL